MPLIESSTSNNAKSFDTHCKEHIEWKKGKNLNESERIAFITNMKIRNVNGMLTSAQVLKLKKIGIL